MSEEKLNYVIYNEDCLEKLDKLKENLVDSIVTDPPYGLTSITKRFGKEGSAPAQYGRDGSFARLSKGFMGKEWDGSGIEYNVELWKKCLKVLKPGGYLLAFGGSRTFHRIACAIEDAGFEIRDTIMWIYGSGFPKSTNIGLAIDKRNNIESKVIGTNKSGKSSHAYQSEATTTAGTFEVKEAQNEWNGWGSALKPSYEPIIVARKPFKGSLVDNVMEYGVGGLNIDECRVPVEQGEYDIRHYTKEDYFQNTKPKESKFQVEPQPDGRFPANTILTYDDTDFNEVCGGFPNTKSGSISKEYKQDVRFNIAQSGKGGNLDYSNCYGDSGSASRYFYCAKASKKDRDEGLEEFEKQKVNDGRKTDADNAFQRGATLRHNIHPTVKPTELMQYLVRLVTPKGGIILDPFMGSGSTGKAVMFENKERQADYKFVGIEKEKEYCNISEARIKWAKEVKNV